MRRMLQASGAEVIHLGHNRSVPEIVISAIQEDVQSIGVSCSQGGRKAFVKYLIDLLDQYDARHIKVFGNGYGAIAPEEISELEEYGAAKIYSLGDGGKWGAQEIANHILESSDFACVDSAALDRELVSLNPSDWKLIARAITAVESSKDSRDDILERIRNSLRKKRENRKVPVLGITGTGGAGKSSLIDEIVLRFLNDQKDRTVGIICIDPTRRKTGGALLGDRIRMNAIYSDRVYYRSMATRSQAVEIPDHAEEAVGVLKAAGFDLIILETAGIGQGDAAVVPLSDVSLYVMTSEFGAQTQLEKIDMLDFADLVAVNKYDQRGSEDAIHDVRKQMQRNRTDFSKSLEEFPVYGTMASRFNDDGVTSLYVGIIEAVKAKTGVTWATEMKAREEKTPSSQTIIIPPERARYLAEIAAVVRRYHAWGEKQETLIRRLWQLDETVRALKENGLADDSETIMPIKQLQEDVESQLDAGALRLISEWDELKKGYSGDAMAFEAEDGGISRERDIPARSRLSLSRMMLPEYRDPGEILRWRLRENLPGMFPFTAGALPFTTRDEDLTQVFGEEGDPFRTNTRFKVLSANSEATRLCVAFDSVTQNGRDPDERPDIYGEMGTSGTSVCTLDDVKVLYRGFDLSAPDTSISMKISAPAPIILAMFFNAAIEQKLDKFQEDNGVGPTPEQAARIREEVLRSVRGTVHADVFEEGQGQSACVFSTDFSLRLMGDVQEYSIKNHIQNFCPVSISACHGVKAVANPITQLAFALADGFTYVEYYLSRGMDIDDFAPNLSFSFSSGLVAEHSVIGRVARRIWAVAIKEKYKGNDRSQKLKCHIETSGRSLHAQDMRLNDIRTILRALKAIYDKCNSFRANSYDEATKGHRGESMRRALAAQLLTNQERGTIETVNVGQGGYMLEELTDLVEEAVLAEFDRLAQRGGVFGAVQTGYQRTKLLDESLGYEALAASGEYPMTGDGSLPNRHGISRAQCAVKPARGLEEEKASQLSRLKQFKERNKDRCDVALERLYHVAQSGGNLFEELMQTVKTCSLGQITQTLFKAGAQYRRTT